MGIEILDLLHLLAVTSGNCDGPGALGQEKGIHRLKHKPLKILPEGVLPGDLQQLGIEGPLPVEILAHGGDKAPAVIRLGLIQGRGKLRIEDPLHQGVLVLEVVVEGLAADAAGLADLPHIDLLKGLGLHQLFQREGQDPLGNVGISHVRLSSHRAAFEQQYSKFREKAQETGSHCRFLYHFPRTDRKGELL